MQIDPARVYGYLAQARGRVFGWVRPLGEEEYTRGFEIGAGSLARTFNHTLIAEWYYVLRLLGEEVPPVEQIIERERNPPGLAELERQWAEQAARTRGALGSIRDWEGEVCYSATDDETGRVRQIVAARRDIFMQLVLHEVHHRAQVLNILRRLGVETEDVDYNLLMYRITDA